MSLIVSAEIVALSKAVGAVAKDLGGSATLVAQISAGFDAYEAHLNNESPVVAVAESLVTSLVVATIGADLAPILAGAEVAVSAAAALDTIIAALSAYAPIVSEIGSGQAIVATLSEGAAQFALGKDVKMTAALGRSALTNIAQLLGSTSDVEIEDDPRQAGGDDNGDLALSGTDSVVFANDWEVEGGAHAIVGVVGSGDQGTIGTDSTATFRGTDDLVSATGPNADIQIGGNGKNASNSDVDSVDVPLGDSVFAFDDSRVAVTGYGAKVQTGTNDSLWLGGDSDKIVVDGNDTNVDVWDSGQAISLSEIDSVTYAAGDTGVVTEADNSDVHVSGSGLKIDEGASDAMGVSGAGDVVDVNGDNSDVTVGGDGKSATGANLDKVVFDGDDSGIVFMGNNSAALVKGGIGVVCDPGIDDTVDLGSTDAHVNAAAGDAVVVSGNTDVISGSGLSDLTIDSSASHEIIEVSNSTITLGSDISGLEIIGSHDTITAGTGDKGITINGQYDPFSGNNDTLSYTNSNNAGDTVSGSGDNATGNVNGGGNGGGGTYSWGPADNHYTYTGTYKSGVQAGSESGFLNGTLTEDITGAALTGTTVGKAWETGVAEYAKICDSYGLGSLNWSLLGVEQNTLYANGAYEIANVAFQFAAGVLTERLPLSGAVSFTGTGSFAAAASDLNEVFSGLSAASLHAGA